MPFPTLPQLLTNPLHAALIAVLITFIMSYIYNRLSRSEESIFDYLISLLYTGALVYTIVFIITNPTMTTATSRLMY